MYFTNIVFVLCCVVGQINSVEANVTGYSCYELQCDGENCLYTTIKDTVPEDVTACRAVSNQVCFIHEENTVSGLRITAGCGHTCDGTPVPTTSEPEHTTEDWSIPKRRKRSTSTVRRECCTGNLCNHDSPCGDLVCSGALSAISDHRLLFVYLLGIFVFSSL